MPTRNDYCIVASDETHADARTRYTYQNGQWEFQYEVNERPFTPEEVAAIESGITSDLVNQYSGHVASISNPHKVNKTQVGLGNVKNVDTTNASNISSGTLSNDRLDVIPFSKLSGVASSAQGDKADTAVQPGDLAGYAKDADVVKITGNQDVDGIKTLLKPLYSKLPYLDISITPTGTSRQSWVNAYDKNGTQVGFIRSEWDGTDLFATVGTVRVINNSTIFAGIQAGVSDTGSRFQTIDFPGDTGARTNQIDTVSARNNAIKAYHDSTKQDKLTTSQLNAVNSGITSELVAQIGTNKTSIETLQTSKQDTITDLDTIRSGASKGATAVQPDTLTKYRKATDQDTIDTEIRNSIPTNNKQLTNGAGYITSSALTGYAKDADVVKITGNQDVGGNKNFTGTLKAPTPSSATDNSTNVATTGWFRNALTSLCPTIRMRKKEDIAPNGLPYTATADGIIRVKIGATYEWRLMINGTIVQEQTRNSSDSCVTTWILIPVKKGDVLTATGNAHHFDGGALYYPY